MPALPTRYGLAMLDARGRLQVGPHREPGSSPYVHVEMTPPTPQTVGFMLDADEARALAAELNALADDIDAGRWIQPALDGGDDDA